MPATIEVRAFLGLHELFRERHWTSPHHVELEAEVSGPELLRRLAIPDERVEVVFVNRKAYRLAAAVVRPGDRVALVPPGVPGPYRMLLGFKNNG